jgi:hypothetical protein
VLTLGELTPGTMFYNNLPLPPRGHSSAIWLVLSVNEKKDTVHMLVISPSSGRNINRFRHDHNCSTYEGRVFLDHEGKDITHEIVMKHGIQ